MTRDYATEKTRQAAVNLDRISPHNRPPVAAFVALKRGQRAASSTIALYTWALHKLDSFTGGKAWAALTHEDASGFMVHLKESGHSYETCRTFSSYIKAFLKWHLDLPMLSPKMLAAFRVIAKGKATRPVLSQDQLASLLDAAECLRDQVLAAVLPNGGFRINELLCLDLRHVELDDKNGAWLSMPNLEKGLKTGPRPVYVAGVGPLLHAYISIHPQRDDPDAPLLL